ncbi:MAG TPA: HXXEE domain-containing protein [Candidatus Krumholzibacteria bacterium]|nr:HXXEE domain-containing protein [Candidatus Krumholzibacteria bacterium]
MDWLYAAPFLAACLHITEEFFFPGGFAEWDRRYRPEFANSITSRLHIIVNVLLLIISYDVFAMRNRSIGPLLWMTVAAIVFTNALWHLRGAWKTHSYSPGMATGILLYIPMTIYGYAHFLRTRAASPQTALLGFAIGASYIFIGPLMHRIRARKAPG